MAEPRTCMECRTEISSETLSGFCPRCLFKLGLDARVEMEPSGWGEQPGSAGDGGVRRFGDYELQGEIARGGMGVVWRARQISLDRPVALKLILAGQMASEAEVQRFLREAQAAANLDHPNIVPIYEVGEHAGHHYFSMRLIEGKSLAQRMAEYQLAGERCPPGGNAEGKKSADERKARIVGLVVQTARAVHHAHQRGVLHRDLKPANILLDAHGAPHVTDFGLAKRVDLPGEMTRSETVVGTPNYMSPEQAHGRHHELTTATDIFSLGAVLYHLLTGRPPFQAPTPWETLRQVVEQEPAPPSDLNRLVDRELETICLKCLEKSPDRRYGSAEALAEDLERWLRGEPVLARPGTEIQRAVKWIRRRPRMAALTGLVILTALAGLGGVSWEWTRAEAARREAEGQRAIARAAEQDAREKLWSSYLAQARATRWSGRPGRRFDSLAAISNAAAMRPSMDLRNEAIACLGLFDVRVERQWQLDPKSGGYQGVVFDASLERYTCARPSGEITIHRSDDDKEILRLPSLGPRDEAILCFSPDGRFLADWYESGTTNFLGIWKLEARKLALALPMLVREPALDFAPDSRTIAAGQTGVVHVYELPSGVEANRIRVDYRPSRLSFDPSGHRLAVCGVERSEAEVIDVGSGRRLIALPHPGVVTSVAWRPDGGRLACACWDTKIYIWDPLAGKTTAVCAGHKGAAMGALFNRGGDVLVSVAFDGAMRFWDPAGGDQLLSVSSGLVSSSPFSPDDRKLGFREGDRGLGIWEIDQGTECRQWRARDTVKGVFVLGGRVLATSHEESVRFWDVGTRENSGMCALKGCGSLAADSTGTTLFACGENGLYRVRLSKDPEPGKIRPEPAERLWRDALTDVSASQDGQTVVCTDRENARVLVFSLMSKGEPEVLECQEGVFSASVSPDGKWVACTPWSGSSVRVWDRMSAKVIRELPLAGNVGLAAFSPRGDRLVVSDPNEIRIWKTSTWELAGSVMRERSSGIVGAIAISPDGETLAGLRGRNHGIVLAALDSGRELATIGEGIPLGFSFDGANLAAWNDDAGKLMVWDLRRIRRELAGMGLDWEGPAFPTQSATP